MTAKVTRSNEPVPILECGGLPPLSRRQLAAGTRGKPRPESGAKAPHSRISSLNDDTATRHTRLGLFELGHVDDFDAVPARFEQLSRARMRGAENQGVG
jgi:hypothetical protein